MYVIWSQELDQNKCMHICTDSNPAMDLPLDKRHIKESAESADSRHL